ncbi:MAG: hemolysin family protein [Candidatus Latescibacterota bacterium]
MTVLFLYFILSLIIVFCCSFLESVILSVTNSYAVLLMKKGRKSGKILRNMKRRINHPLAAILTFNTIGEIVGAAAVGAQTYHVFGSTWVAFSSAVMTICILFFGELVPKTLGASHWKKAAPFAAYLITFLIYLAYPVVIILELVSRILSHKSTQTPVSREEIIVLAENAASEGVLLKKEARIIENLLLLSEIRTEDILTPRSVIAALQKDMTVSEAMSLKPPIQFTRIPVYNRGLDDVIGLVHRYKLIEVYCLQKGDTTIEELMGPIYAVPESKPIADLLDEFIDRREHLFEVVDEYGGTAGIVTLEDVLETLLGVEIVDEFDSVEDMQAYAIEKWKQRRLERNI